MTTSVQLLQSVLHSLARVPSSVSSWLKERSVAILGFSESVIAVLVGFGHVDWSAEQTGLVMALVSASLSVIVLSERRELRQQVALHELAAVERSE